MTIDVRPAGEDDQRLVISVITLAFSNDPMARWAFPDPATYLDVMPDFVRAFGGNGFARGAAHLADDGGGAAMWLPPGVQPDSETMMALTERHILEDRLNDMMEVFAQMDQFHPSDAC